MISTGGWEKREWSPCSKTVPRLEPAAQSDPEHVSDDHGAAEVGDATGARLLGGHVGDVGDAGEAEDDVATGEVLQTLKS